MNVEVIGRIRPPIRAEGPENLVIEGHRVAAQSKGPFINFATLHRKDTDNYGIFKNTIEDSLLHMHMSRFNVCLLVIGETESGKSYTLTGEGSSKTGIVPMVLDYLFSKLQDDQYMMDTRVRRQNPTVTLQMYEVYNELVKDLLQVPGGGASYCDLAESANRGVYVKNGSEVPLRDSNDGNAKYRQGMSRRTQEMNDFGPASANSATIIYIDLSMDIITEDGHDFEEVGNDRNSSKSRFTIVEIPGLEKLSDNPSYLRQRETSTLSKGLIAFNSVITSLASNPFPDRVISYRDSKLTHLLKEELGGNCKTTALLCLKPQSDPNTLSPILTFATRVGQVKNFPIVNDLYAQNLITQYRARILELQQQSGVGPSTMDTKVSNLNDIKETIRQLETENLKLKDDNERLRSKVDQLQSRFGNMASTKTDLSQQLLMTEEEKLKVSQSLVEMQIENNKIREEAEATKFELTNKILMLENSLMEAEAERDKFTRSARNAKERLSEMEKDRKDLADEYVVLKTNYLALVRESEKESKRNEELSIELLNLVNAKATLMKQVQALSDSDHGLGDPDAEISRVKAIVIKNSSGRIKADEILGSQENRKDVENTLFTNRKRYEKDMDKLKREYGDEQQRLEGRVTLMQKEIQESRNLARDRQRRIAELNAALIIARGEKEQLEVSNNRMHHKVKDIGEDYRARLIKYVEDIAEYVDKGSGPDPRQSVHMREYVDNMLKDISKSHKEREEQLSMAAQQYRENKKALLHKYEELLIHYRNLRLQSEQRGIDDIDMGPDETELKLNESEIDSANLREITRLKTTNNELRKTLDNMKMRYGVKGDTDDYKIRPGEKPAETWAALRKQLREYTLNTQQQLEDERAKLLSENSMLKEQLKESQEYIDHHLIRYKQEIVKLRRLLGYEDDSGVVHTDRSFRKGRRK
ncbi:coiled-coil domain-containing protein 78-like [Mytilus edulis]|uniref:coiled-coil domain-containing protein 78-like n=1 Tax=Mytilus edulis TaxID=6550 RepID=UPI0039EFC1D7